MLRNICLLALVAVLALTSCTKRKPEEPDYAPNSPYNPYPPDSSTNIDHTTLDVTLSWAATDPNSGDPLTYDIYLDTLNPPLIKIASGLTSPSYFMTGLNYNTTYYWNLYVTDGQGAITSGPVWRFTTLPHANSAPSLPAYLCPPDNASWQYPTIKFGVNCSDPDGITDTLHYELYLGVTTQPSVTAFKNDTSSFREISGLDYSTAYYWKIVAHDNHFAYTSGPTYSFTTRECPWFYKREMPSPRYGFGTAVVNGKIYVIGGYDGLNYLAEVLEYDPATDAWTRRADMPTPRSQLAVAVWNGKIYAIGGSQDLNELKNSAESYDPILDSWELLAPAPVSHYWATANAVDGNIFFIGATPSIFDINTGIYQYSVSGNAWTKTTTYWPDTIWTDSTRTVVDTIVTYSIYGYLWAKLPVARVYYCSAASNGLIYIMGGTTKNGEFPAEVDVYHPETKDWTRASDMTGPASGCAVTMANGCIYAVGGYNESSSKRVRKYDPAIDAWFIRSDLNVGRSFLGAAGINNCIYAYGGVALFPLSTVEEYRLDLDPKFIAR